MGLQVGLSRSKPPTAINRRAERLRLKAEDDRERAEAALEIAPDLSI
jgi:hypothetical protein